MTPLAATNPAMTARMLRITFPMEPSSTWERETRTIRRTARGACLLLNAFLRRTPRQAEHGAGAGGAVDRGEKLRAAGRAVGGRSRIHRPGAIGHLCRDQEVNSAFDLRAVGGVADQRENIQRLASRK